ncbi:hypothetical protein LCGC14_1238510 [marine sediment metagenome]|uniref:Uncharacterized protein n=1 Tax=marine sediment metagenome TaxID=412755 RepID=A0A0F9LAL3_9ZZZZ
MGIRNKKEALDHLNYIECIIKRMTPGNLAHHRESIRDNMEELKKYLKGNN